MIELILILNRLSINFLRLRLFPVDDLSVLHDTNLSLVNSILISLKLRLSNNILSNLSGLYIFLEYINNLIF